MSVRRRNLLLAVAVLVVVLVAGYAMTLLLFESGGRTEQPRTLTARTSAPG